MEGTSDEPLQTTDVVGDHMTELTVNLVRAYLANHTVPPAQLCTLLEQTHRTVLGLANFRAEPTEAVSVEASLRDDCIACLECGKFFRSLKRHLAVHHGMAPDQYRARWSLAADYPMVAPDYAASRSELARSMGLGGKRRRKKRSAAKEVE